jgi:Ser/Thr protein kinase RdoA (MazF antagonist)
MDLAGARRGYHDAVVAGYLKLRPLPAAQLAALDALWTASLFTWIWVMLEEAERAGVLEVKAFSWHVDQFAKTRPFAGGASREP